MTGIEPQEIAEIDRQGRQGSQACRGEACIEGMTCASCARWAERGLLNVPGVEWRYVVEAPTGIEVIGLP